MEANKVEQLLLLNGSKIPTESIPLLREKLSQSEDVTMAQLAFSQLKDPILSLVLSITLGYWGVDRFYIGDIGMGIGKVLTCGGAYIWYIIDIFLIMDATKKKNLETILMQIR